MLSYKIYLTKSLEAAGRIALSFGGENKTDDILRVKHGKMNGEDCIPKIYRDKGFYFCIVELKENGENDTPTYELTIC